MENCRTKNGEDNFEEETSRHTFKTYFVAKVIKTVLNQLKGRILIYKHTKLGTQKQNHA